MLQTIELVFSHYLFEREYLNYYMTKVLEIFSSYSYNLYQGTISRNFDCCFSSNFMKWIKKKVKKKVTKSFQFFFIIQ